MLTVPGVDESQLEDMVKNLPKDMDLSALADQVKDNAAFNTDQIKDMMKGMGIEGDLHMCNYYWDILYMRPALGNAIINIAFFLNKGALYTNVHFGIGI